jgi:hypothetical protein
VYSELDARPSDRWTVMFFGRERRALSWKLAAIVVALASVSAALVVYLTAGSGAEPSGAAPPETTGEEVAATDLASVVPTAIWQDCHVQTVANARAEETAVCVPASGTPDRWEISRYPNGVALASAYRSELGKRADIERDSGKCNAFAWGGELQWQHGPGKPGGRVFCYFDGNDAVIVWTHEKFGQPNHRDVLGIAREGGSDHARLYIWWQPWHHLIGKAV